MDLPPKGTIVSRRAAGTNPNWELVEQFQFSHEEHLGIASDEHRQIGRATVARAKNVNNRQTVQVSCEQVVTLGWSGCIFHGSAEKYTD